MVAGKSKAAFVADALNRTLMNLIIRCTKSEGTRDYFHVGVLGYGDSGVRNGFSGSLGNSILNPISLIESNPTRVEDRKKKMDDGAGGIMEQSIKFPIWFEPKASGGTPMRGALTKAAEEIANWCDSHPEGYPPTILHITDGESTDGDPEDIATAIKQLRSNDGEALLMNIHVKASGNEPVKFPASESNLLDQYSKMLFRMSSLLPANLARYAQDKGYPVSNESRAFMFNAEVVELVDFFDIGTRASQLR